MDKKTLRTVTTSMAGNLFEWYDYALFGYFAPIIGHLFNPSDNKTTELIYAYGIFAVGFLMRPLGALIFGRIGDRFGRKRALVISISLMAFPTTCIAFLPTYEQIGVTATFLLILIRMIQGISIGGNYGGSVTYVIEHTPIGSRGIVSSFASNSIFAGFLLGSATSAILSNLMSPQDLGTWGWRLPFLLGVLVAFIGYYIHSRLDESPEFQKEQAAKTVTQTPFREVFTNYSPDLLRTVLIIMIHDISTYVFFVFFGTYLQTRLGLPEATVSTLNTFAMAVCMCTSFLAGYLSDIYGRKSVQLFGVFGFAALSVPLFNYMPHATFAEIVAIQFTFASLIGLVTGAMAVILAESYPTRVRYSAVALTVNISGPLFGGTAPMLMSWLIGITGSQMVPAYYITGAAIISFCATLFLKERFKTALE